MKKYIVYILIAMSFFGMSCMKDMTNLDITPVDPIVIDTTGFGLAESYSKFQGDSLKLQIKATKSGLSSENLKYEWGINAFQGYKRIVGTGKNLAAKITEAPGEYSLVYTVTDTTTKQKVFFTWRLYVNSAYGNGLIVADTRDGITSDYNLIMCYNFTPEIWDDTEFYIYRNLYSDANFQKINGIVKSVSYMKYNSENRILTGITDNAIFRVNPLDYKFKDLDNQCFVLPPDGVSPAKIQSIQSINAHEYIVNNGLLHCRNGSNSQFNYRYLADNLDYSCSNICGLQNPGPPTAPGGLLYDEKNNRFLLAPPFTSATASITAFPVVDNSGTPPAFDPRNIGNKTCLHLEEGQSSRILAVMKDKSSAQYSVYQVKLTPLNGKMGHSLNDISNNPEINLSKYYTCSSQENVLFYATDNRVYATTLLVGGGSAANLRYTVENGEKITGMQMHRNQGYMALPSLTKPADYNARREVGAGNRLLILSTYNEATKNGKIITIPLETVGVGGLVTNPAYITTFSGFGKITAFGNQNQ